MDSRGPESDPGEDGAAGAQRIGRYELYGVIAAGGMATVHLGRLLGAAGFSRTVAIKRLRSHLVAEPDFHTKFVDEARLASRVRHPNVVATLDVAALGDELLLVMDYVEGESVARLAAKGPPPFEIVVSIIRDTLYGLHAAHVATDPRGEALRIVHRDVSPQNIMVGVDGIARVLDFGVAKAAWRLRSTEGRQLQGKIPYMAPEQLAWKDVDQRTDVYAAGVVLWELLTGVRLFPPGTDIASRIHGVGIDPPSLRRSSLPVEIDGIVLRALATDPAERWPTALDMAAAIEEFAFVPSPREVGAWVMATATQALADRALQVAFVERRKVPLPSASSTPTAHVPKLSLAGDAPTAVELATAVEPGPGAPSGGAFASRLKRRGLFKLIGGLLVVLGAVLWTWWPRHGPDSNSAIGTSSGSDHHGSLTVSGAAATAPDPDAAAISATAATLSSAAPALAFSGPVRHPVPVRATSPAPPRVRASGCDPPYSLGVDGVKRFKVQCF